MTPEHKDALARGREVTTVVKTYLSALDANAPRLASVAVDMAALEADFIECATEGSQNKGIS
ncbi:MAG: hypothetical protein GXP35_13250 [Actinobacteria bacterium]|nr:hypothetical protein [Actinomycetota bacterium]